MKGRLVILIVLALVMAGGTVVFVQKFLSQQKPTGQVAKRPKAAVTRVLVAKKGLPSGTILKAVDLRWQSWPDKALPREYFVQGRIKPAMLAGAVVRHGVVAGQPITRASVVKPGERGFLAAVLRPGMRAVTIPITVTSGVAGMIFPGDRVDVILLHRVTVAGAGGKTRNQQIGETVMTNLRILAIDQRTDDQTKKPAIGRTATFEVTPKQAEAIVVAQQIGRLSLSLRSLAKDDTRPILASKTVKPKTVGSKTKTGVTAVKVTLKPKDGLLSIYNRPIAQRGRTFTRDTGVSRVLRGSAVGTSVQIVRGAAASHVSVAGGGIKMSRGASTTIVTPGQATKVIPGALTGKK
ncbi:MAG: Flp pilus assembly protein CpaB [Pseudomonadota bacterium]